jgi:mRNA interferase MazF
MAVPSQAASSHGDGDVAIRNWKEAGLLKPSVLKAVITTIEKRLVLRRLGRLAAVDRQALSKALRSALGG